MLVILVMEFDMKLLTIIWLVTLFISCSRESDGLATFAADEGWFGLSRNCCRAGFHCADLLLVGKGSLGPRIV